MLAAAFTIRFAMLVDGASIGKIRNFGEELLSRMREENLGNVDNPDSAIDSLSISISSRRRLGAVRKLIRRLLAKHYLDAYAVVTEI